MDTPESGIKMVDRLFNTRDRVCAGDICGEVVAVLSPQQSSDSDECVPRYRIRLENGLAVILAQNDLRPEVEAK